MRHRHRARFFRVVNEVALREAAGVADDLAAVLVRADRAVRAEAVEESAHDIVGLDGKRGIEFDAGVRDVVTNADREVIVRLLAAELVEHALDHRRSELFRGEAEAAADDDRHFAIRLAQRADDVEIKRLPDRARLLRAIEHRDRANASRDARSEAMYVERTEESHVDDSHAFPERVDRFRNRLACGSHRHDDALRIGGAVILVRRVRASNVFREPLHRLRDDVRAVAIERIGALARLEENVGILRRAANHRMIGSERAAAMIEDQFRVDHRLQIVIGQQRHLRDLVRRAEAVEEMEERDARLERRGLRDQREVLRLLHARGTEHRPAGRARGHDVAVIAEDRQRVCGQRTRGDVKDRRRQLAGDLVHVRNHQQQALRRGKRRGERSGLQRAMHGARGTALALHLDHRRDRSPEVRLFLGRPRVRPLAHRRRGRDRIDGDDFIERVRNARDGFVSIEKSLHAWKVNPRRTSGHDDRQRAA